MFSVINNITSSMMFYLMFVVNMFCDVLLTIPNYVAEAF